MNDEKTNSEQLLRITIRMGEGLVREGRLPLPELTDEQLDERFREGIRQTLRDDKFDVALTFDHTNKLLHQAASYEGDHDAEASSLFYMLWVEHRTNLIARVMLRRIAMPDDESVFIIRKFSVREKVTILWRLLRLQPFPPEALKVLTTIEEFRNGFVISSGRAFLISPPKTRHGEPSIGCRRSWMHFSRMRKSTFTMVSANESLHQPLESIDERLA